MRKFYRRPNLYSGHYRGSASIIGIFVGVLIFSSAVLLWAAFPFSASAQGLVPCGTSANPTPCQPCHIFALIQNILNFLWWYISIPIATLMLAYGGFLLMLPSLGSGSPPMLAKGRKILKNTVIGVLIIFFAWLFVDTIIKVIAGQGLASGTPALIPRRLGLSPGNLGPWNEVECSSTGPSPFVPPAGGPGGHSGPSGPSAPHFPSPGDVAGTTCPTCVKLSVSEKHGGAGACKDQVQGQICMVDGELNDKLIQLNQKLAKPNDYWWVTEGWPPTVTHQNPCHQTGTCVDANLRGSAAGNPTEIVYFVEKSKEAGLVPIYEVKTDTRRQDLISQGVPKEHVCTVPQITGEHFSIYKSHSLCS